jgi:hypothetical protein
LPDIELKHFVITGPRNRAPLGAKTTNAKAKGLQTPAPLSTVKPEKTNRKGSSSRKVKKVASVANSEQIELLGKPKDDDVPDIEYMPPRPKGKALPSDRQFAVKGCVAEYLKRPSR